MKSIMQSPFHVVLAASLIGCVSPNVSKQPPFSKATSNNASNRPVSSQMGSWHQWHLPSNMTSSGYCVVKFEYDSSDIGEAWLYKLEGHELKPVQLLAKNINASLDLDTIYETSRFVEILLTYRHYDAQVLRYDLATESVTRDYKTSSGVAVHPVFPHRSIDGDSSSGAIVTEFGPVLVWGVKGKGESVISLVSPDGTIEHRTSSTVYGAALIEDSTLMLYFGQHDSGDLDMVVLPVKKLLEKEIESHFQPVKLIPAPR